jgi:hypothetical protein
MAGMSREGDRITSEEQIKAPIQGIHTTALNLVEQFCRKQGLDPAEFMSRLSIDGSKVLDNRELERGVEWKKCIRWDTFNKFVFQYINTKREGDEVVGRGLNQAKFTRSLGEIRGAMIEKDKSVERQAAAEQAQAAAPSEQQARSEEITSAAQVRVPWENIQRYALDLVKNYCRENHIPDAGVFMEDMGWLKKGAAADKDWEQNVNWLKLNPLIMGALATKKDEKGDVYGVGIKPNAFTKMLASEHMGRVRIPAREETAQAPHELEQLMQKAHEPGEEQARVRRDWRESVASPGDNAGVAAIEEAGRVLDRYTKLSDVQRISLATIVSRNAPERLVDMNLDSYRNALVEKGRLTEDQADMLITQLRAVADGAREARKAEERAGTRVVLRDEQGERYVPTRPAGRAEQEPALEAPAEEPVAPVTKSWKKGGRGGEQQAASGEEERRVKAPTRTQTYILTIGTVGDKEQKYTITSPAEIHSPSELVRMMRDPAAELTIRGPNGKPVTDREELAAFIEREQNDPIGYVDLNRKS